MFQLTPLRAELLIGLIIILLLGLVYFIHTQGFAQKPKETSGLGIQQVLTQVKAELNQTSAAEKGAAMFSVKSFDLELNFIVKKSESGSADIKTEVISIGGQTGTSSETTQKITLHMEPVPGTAVQGGPSTAVTSQTNTVPLTKRPPDKENK